MKTEEIDNLRGKIDKMKQQNDEQIEHLHHEFGCKLQKERARLQEMEEERQRMVQMEEEERRLFQQKIDEERENHQKVIDEERENHHCHLHQLEHERGRLVKDIANL